MVLYMLQPFRSSLILEKHLTKEMTDQCLFLSLSNDLMRPPFYVFFPRFALKHHIHASEPLKQSVESSFIIFVFFNCSNSLSSSSNSACHLSHSELKSCCSRSTPSKISSPSSLCTGCHLLPTLPKKSWGFKKVGAIWNRVNSHWALISYLSLECLNLKQHVRQMKR